MDDYLKHIGVLRADEQRHLCNIVQMEERLESLSHSMLDGADYSSDSSKTESDHQIDNQIEEYHVLKRQRVGSEDLEQESQIKEADDREQFSILRGRMHEASVLKRKRKTKMIVKIGLD